MLTPCPSPNPPSWSQTCYVPRDRFRGSCLYLAVCTPAILALGQSEPGQSELQETLLPNIKGKRKAKLIKPQVTNSMAKKVVREYQATLGKRTISQRIEGKNSNFLIWKKFLNKISGILSCKINQLLIRGCVWMSEDHSAEQVSPFTFTWVPGQHSKHLCPLSQLVSSPPFKNDEAQRSLDIINQYVATENSFQNLAIIHTYTACHKDTKTHSHNSSNDK